MGPDKCGKKPLLSACFHESLRAPVRTFAGVETGRTNELPRHAFPQYLLPIHNCCITFGKRCRGISSRGNVAVMRQGRAATGRHRRLLGLGLTAILGVLAVIAAVRGLSPLAGLAEIEHDVTRRWPQVAQIQRAQLSTIRTQHRTDVIIFDVREHEEHAVSHLPAAIQVDPAITREQLLMAHGATASGTTIVFYCSVGVRSSELAARVQDDLKRGGATQVYNLSGGIFGWHNDGRPLVDARGATDHVHGYDARWRRVLTRQAQVTTGS